MAQINVSMNITDMPEFKRILAAIEEEKKKLWTDEEVLQLVNTYTFGKVWWDDGLLRKFKIEMGKIMP